MSELAAGFQSLPPEYQHVILLAQDQHHIAVTPLQTLAGGWSGALIYLVSVAPAAGPVQHLILKLDRKGKTARTDEISRHVTAHGQSPAAFARAHLAELAFERVEAEGAIGIFYSIAGQSLQAFRPLSSYGQQQQLETLFIATNHYLLDEWNAGLAFDQALHPQALLARWLGFRLDPGSPIERFISQLGRASPDRPGFLLQSSVFPNPLWYARHSQPWGSVRPIDVLVGLQHGDLNTNNILVKFGPDGQELTGYYLIDFALFKDQMPLLYDLRYLEMSYLLLAIAQVSLAKGVDLILRLAEPDGLDPRRVPIEMAGTAAVLRAARGAFERWVADHHRSLQDDLWGQYWLAGAAAGLAYCHKAGQPDEQRLAGLLYAAANLKRFAAVFGLPLPTDVEALNAAGPGTGMGPSARKTLTNLPSGTVTFLFTDIEGSAQLWEREPDTMRLALARHDAILRQAVQAQHGQMYKVIGDAIQAVFVLPTEALAAALAAQRELAAVSWPTSAPLRVRMGLNTGPAETAGADYATTHTLNRVARIMAAAHGGQTLLSAETAELVRGELPTGVGLRDLGQHRMKGLARREHLFQLDVPDLPREFPPLATLDAVPNNLPVQLTSFIGREQELAEVEAQLESTRLLTLTGSGGTGKTRLSLQAAERSLPAFPDGAWLVELAALADPAQVLPALAAGLGLQAQPGQALWDVVSNYLRARASLLVLDNCEHLVEACARLAEDLLRACPRLKILASSREALGVPGETAYRVPSLSLPQGDDLTRCESARLFIARAQAASSRFALTPANAPALAQICRRLDGIPLAIELAAARVKALSLEQIAARLDDRFQLLTGGSRTALPRQQTLRALIDWSYDLLSEPERVLFRRLAVFAGGWSLEAAEAVCGEDERRTTASRDEGSTNSSFVARRGPSSVSLDVLDLLTRLVDKSLILMDEQAGAARYHRLETIRQYAREKLFESGEAAALRDRHLAYFAQLAAQAEPHLRGPHLVDWLDRLAADYDNVRAAVEWGLERDPEAALRMAGHINMFLFTRGHFEARGWLETALSRVPALPPAAGAAANARARAVAMGWSGISQLMFGQGDLAASLQAATNALAAAEASGEKILISLVETMRATRLALAHDVAATRTAAEHGLALAREANEPTLELMPMVLLAWAMGESGEQAAQQALIAEAARLRAQTVSPLFYAPLIFLGLQARLRGDLALAREYFQEVVRLTRLLGLRGTENAVYSELAHTDRLAGDFPAALAGYGRAILVWKDLGNRGAVANLLECFGFIAIARGQPERAARLLGAAEALREVASGPMLEYERVEYESHLATLRAALDPARLDEAWAAGRALDIDHVIAYALHEDTDARPGQRP